jgi:alcohol dehydrogenase class IV/acyl-CoA reductase-like NAD-dependent aldehyde dehydrogenase
MSIPHIPVWRFGRAYESLNRNPVKDCRSGEVLAEVSLANAGIIRKDLRGIARAREALRALPTMEWVRRGRRAAELFLSADLPLGGGRQSAVEYVNTLSATSGLPRHMCRANMEKVAYVMGNFDLILRGLTRALPFAALDQPPARIRGVWTHFVAATDVLGVVLPSNSPGVNSLWVPALALKIPVLLKPGREEPWTPWRAIQAMIAAGFPGEAFGFYPADHEGAGAVMDGCGRAIIFGDAATVERYRGDPKFSVHGPGFSKVLVGEDQVDRFPEFLDVLVDSVARNGGRSCVNASTIVVPRRGEEIARALAARLAALEPRPLHDDAAPVSAFANPTVAAGVEARIAQALETPGARDLTAEARGGSPRLAEVEGSTFLRPTLIWCEDAQHPLAKTEYMFPFASVVEVPADRMLEYLGPSLVVAAITEDPALREALLRDTRIGRLNLGRLPTSTVEWDQPHEGNLFEFLYTRRAIMLPKAGSSTPPAAPAFDHLPMPTRLVSGAGCLAQLGALARELGGTHALLVSDEGIRRAGHLDRAEASLRAAGLAVTCFTDVRENPTTEDVDRCLAVARTAPVDLIIGLGGGSSLDTAKGGNFLLTNGGRMRDYHGTGKATRPLLPMIAVPTTAGTGSETQFYAVIADAETHVKMACGDPKAAFRVALLDPELTLTQPPFVAACTGLDALTHAVEAAVSTRGSPLSWAYATDAFRRLHPAFERMLEDPADLAARADLQTGAALAGLAIAAGMLGAAHALANPLTARHGVVHGQAVANLLPHVVRYNAEDPAIRARYDALARAGGLDDTGELVSRLEDLLDRSGLRLALPPDADLPALAALAAAQWTAGFNPRPVDAAALENLYRRLAAGS